MYHDRRHAAGYSTPSRLWAATKERSTPKEISGYLQGEDSYTLHAPSRRNFPRNVTYADNIDDCWQTDLSDLQSLSEDNDGNKYLLCVIDVFSKFAWVVPLKSKSAPSIVQGFEQIFASTERRCTRVVSDKGKEFVNASFQSFLKKHDIKFYHTNNPDTKASVVERFQKTLKSTLFKVFTHTENYRYAGGVLQDIVHAYNSKYHRSIKMSPIEASSPERVLEVYQNLYGKSNLQVKKKVKFIQGDYVRISREKKHFEKGYTWNWSEEIFKIIQVIPHSIPVYKIQDLDGEDIEGSFYSHELIKVTKPEAFKIAYIVQSKGKGDSRKHLVHWRGYPIKSRSWIKDKDIL